jgi:hypothetical protein
MLKIVVGAVEAYDESTDEIIMVDGTELELEHSLVSLSKWESEFEEPFLGQKEKTTEQVIAYIKAMTLTPDVPDEVYLELSEENFQNINEYLDAKMSATWFSEQPGAPKSKEVITAELIYYWMVVFQIPFECETWHLNRLFTLIRICNVKQSKPEKMPRAEIAQRNRELNAQRKKQLGTRG